MLTIIARKPVRPRTIGRVTGVEAPRVMSRELVCRETGPSLFDLPFVELTKPKPAEKLPIGERWQYEIRQDGYLGAQCHVAAGRARILTKRGLDLADKLPEIARDF